MQSAGTSTVARRFCRRASRKSAVGWKTDGDDGFLLSRSGMGSRRRAFKHRAVMIRRHFNNAMKFKAARLDGLGGLAGRHSQFGFWTARLAQDRGFLARPPMPVHHRKQSRWQKRIVNRTRQPRSIRYAVEGVCQEHKIDRPRPQPGEFVRVPRYEIAIRDTAFDETVPRYVQQIGVDIDGHDMPGELGNLQREPAVARTQIHHRHVRLYPDSGKDYGRIGPQRLPPAGIRHFRAGEKSWELTGHVVKISSGSKRRL